jgi:hypothetical protein
MSALSAQLPALVGVVVGVAATTGGALLTDRFRWRRDHHLRWDANRLDALVAYSAALKVEARLCLRVSGSRWPGTTSNPMSIEAGQTEIALAEDRRSEAFESVLLLANAATVEAARTWQVAVWRLHEVLDPAGEMDRASFGRAFREAGQAREDFYQAARLGLDVKGERHRPAPWLDPGPGTI